MRVFACAFLRLLALAFTFAAPAAAAPRVASLKLCSDELVLMLAAPEQIASVTHLAQNPLETPLWRKGRRYRRNDGTLVSVVPARPDLVIDMGRAGDRIRIAERLGIRTLQLPYPQSIADVERSIASMARALGREAEGRRVLSRIATLKRSRPSALTPAAFLGGGGRSLAAEGLGAEWMALAGLRQQRLPGDRLTLEQMLTSPPPILLRSDYRHAQYSSERMWLRHPLARQVRGSREIGTDGRRWTCMGPLMIGEVLRLRGRLAR